MVLSTVTCFVITLANEAGDKKNPGFFARQGTADHICDKFWFSTGSECHLPESGSSGSCFAPGFLAFQTY